jgi:hypothetical protein
MQKILNKIRLREDAVSQIVGYVLTILICGMILTSSTLIMGTYLEERKKAVARIEAQAIANRVVNIIIEAVTVKQMMSTAEFERRIDLPYKISDYDYYVEATDNAVWVKTADGEVNESCSTYNVVEELIIEHISGKVYSGNKYLLISLDNTDCTITPVTIQIKEDN